MKVCVSEDRDTVATMITSRRGEKKLSGESSTWESRKESVKRVKPKKQDGNNNKGAGYIRVIAVKKP